MTTRNDSENNCTRREFVKGVAAVAAGTTVFAADRPAAVSAPNDEKPQSDEKRAIKHILLFVHPPSKFSQNRLGKPNATAESNWIKLIAEKGADDGNIMCVLRGSHPDNPLEAAGKKYFADRCFINPLDFSQETRSTMLGDLNRTFHGRGNYGEWNPYEISSAPTTPGNGPKA